MHPAPTLHLALNEAQEQQAFASDLETPMRRQRVVAREKLLKVLRRETEDGIELVRDSRRQARRRNGSL